MRTPSLPLVVLSLVAPACFSPGSVEAEDSEPTAGSASEGEAGDTEHGEDPTAGPGGNPTSAGSAEESESGDPTDASDTDASDTDDDATESGDPTGGPLPNCGDGQLDDGEECDDGDGNGPTAACLDTCALNVCGDGFVGPDEECDDGDGNGPTGACLDACVANVCGDGFVGPEEACDDGAENTLAIGACAPDCSTVIETRRITMGTFPGGNFGNLGTFYLDSLCPDGYDAMFAIAGEREVTSTPYAADNIVDWPVKPYTAYTTTSGTLMWITDELPLLGVRHGVPDELEQNLLPPCAGTCITNLMVSGLRNDWTTATANTCNGWTSDNPALGAAYASARATTNFLDGGTTLSCEGTAIARIFCVEQ